MVRYLPLALLTPLSALCVEAVAQPQNDSREIHSSDSNVASLIETSHQSKDGSESDSTNQADEQPLNNEISEGNDSDATGVMEPLVLSQSNESASASEEEEDEEDSWRVYLDLYAFLPPITRSTSTIDGNTTKVDLPLSDVIKSIDEALTLKAQFEYGRLGVLAAINYATISSSTSRSSFLETQNPLRDKLGIASPLRKRTIRVQGDLDVDVDASQTIFDLAMRYRAGAIQKPRMKKGSTSFLGLVGARFIDASLSTDFNIKGKTDVTVEGVKVNRSNSRELEKSSNVSWGNTWVQPMLGMFGTYAISEDWQAFAYLDAGGFGLSGSEDLSGTAQAGIAYALGNSAQISLSYKYFGIAYFEGGRENNGYSSYQSGVNLGLRWLFD
ncbi:hypothetical protein MITS9509_01482 [Synechococcus sp. MIT S9509]|nr:hypothetical protein MITS9504_01169 [Synechococcus sp. MIT S9504]KZR92491.1 hypothetical protein MITS9509_01482 [Synechococcus sp. MIT S9509]